MSLHQGRKLKNWEEIKTRHGGACKCHTAILPSIFRTALSNLSSQGAGADPSWLWENAAYILDSLPVYCRTNAERCLCIKGGNWTTWGKRLVTRQTFRLHDDGSASWIQTLFLQDYGVNYWITVPYGHTPSNFIITPSCPCFSPLNSGFFESTLSRDWFCVSNRKACQSNKQTDKVI